MNKLLYILVASVSLLFPGIAKADIEIVQKVVTTLERVSDESSVVLQKYNAAKEEVINTYEGTISSRSKFKDKLAKLKEKRNAKKLLKSKVNPNVADVNNLEKTEKAIEDNYMVQLGQGNETAKSQEQDVRMKLIITENVAQQYAKAFTTRTNIAIEDEPDIDRSDTQEIINATKAKADSISRRYISIWDLDNAYIEFFVTDLSKEFSGGDEDDSSEKGGAK